MLNPLSDAQVSNPVVLAGDIHSTWVSELKLDFDQPQSPSVAVELVAPSVSSDFPAAFDAPIKAANPFLNPHVHYFDGLRHGYLRCEVDREQWRTDVRVVDSIAVRDTPRTRRPPSRSSPARPPSTRPDTIHSGPDQRVGGCPAEAIHLVCSRASRNRATNLASPSSPDHPVRRRDGPR
jgi:phosphodiesterase/alkaline phosphatase D-like protein